MFCRDMGEHSGSDLMMAVAGMALDPPFVWPELLNKEYSNISFVSGEH